MSEAEAINKIIGTSYIVVSHSLKIFYIFKIINNLIRH